MLHEESFYFDWLIFKSWTMDHLNITYMQII